MALDFGIVETFINEYRDAMREKTVLRHERYKILQALTERLRGSLRDYETFEKELAAVIKVIGSTESFEDLRLQHERSVAGVRNYYLEEQTAADVNDLFRIIRDAITIKVLKLVEDEMIRDGLGAAPCDYCWIGLGSEGRDEQTFVTDQDNMLIYALKGGNAGEAESYYEDFAARAVERLNEVGFSKCKGGIMPSNKKWRGSVEDWKKRIGDTLTRATEELELLDLIILTDARLIKGGRRSFDTVVKTLFSLLAENRSVMQDLIESAIMMPTALGFFGRFKVEAEGNNKGKFNLKLLGWSPLIMCVRAFALEEGLYETNTLRRIRLLRQRNMIKKEVESDLVDAYLLFVKFKLTNQIQNSGEGDPSFVNPDILGPEEATRLRKGMRVIEAFQKYIHEVLLFGQPI